MKNLCIIPARGGSKRIPRKNIKDFLGKPIIAYSIEAALKSGLFDEVMVSTDDEEIAKIAKIYGANIPFMRSAQNANDYATTVNVILEVITSFEKLGRFFVNICCLYPCAPLVKMESLEMGLEKLEVQKFDSVIPIVPFSFPIQRSFKLHENKVSYLYPEYEKVRSQDLQKAFHDTGQFYWSSVESLKNNKTLVTKNAGFIALDELHVQDIDNEMDWKMAELKYKLIYGK
jgi:pseudaminic acid cytidylyltransferase